MLADSRPRELDKSAGCSVSNYNAVPGGQNLHPTRSHKHRMVSVHANRRLTAWFRQWRLPLRRFLLGRAGIPAADVDDVAQEVFLRLMRYERTELVDHPQAYLYKVASNVAAEWSIRACNSRPHDERGLVDLIDHEQPDSQLERAESADEIERGLNTLTPYQREVLKLFFVEGKTYAEIAAQLGESLRSVTRQFRKSYEKLRHELNPELLRDTTDGRK